MMLRYRRSRVLGGVTARPNRRPLVVAAAVLGALLVLVLLPHPPGHRLLRTVRLPDRFLAIDFALAGGSHSLFAQTWDPAAPLAGLSGVVMIDSRTGDLMRAVLMPHGAAARGVLLDQRAGRTVVIRTSPLRTPADAADTGSDWLTLYRSQDGAPVASVLLGRSPAALAAGSGSGRLYLLTNVLASISRPVLIALGIRDGATGRTLQVPGSPPGGFLPTPANSYAIGAAVDEDAGRLLIVAQALPTGYFGPHRRRSPVQSGSLFLVDSRRPSTPLLARLALGPISPETTSLALDAAHSRAIVITPGRVLLIDSSVGTLVRALRVPGVLPIVAIDPVAGRFYLLRSGPAGALLTADLTTGAIRRVTPLGQDNGPVAAMTLDARRHRLYFLYPRLDAATPRPGLLTMRDSDSGRLLDTVPAGGAPYSMVLDQQAARLLVFNHGYGARAPAAAPATRLVQTPTPGWAQPSSWLPWLAHQASPPPDVADPTISVIDASR